MKKRTFFTAVFLTSLGTALLFCFTACKMDVPISKPAVDNREPITESDIFGDYDGIVIPVMNGIVFGKTSEKIQIKKSPVTKKITFRTREQTSYKSIMPADLSYGFKEITLVPAADRKSFSFSATGGYLRLHSPPSDTTGEEVSTKTVLKDGSIYKKEGKVYIKYIIEYDVNDIRATIPTLPKDHKTLASVMKNGVKQ